MKKSNTKVFTLQSFPPNIAFEHDDDDDLPVTDRQCRDVLFIFIFMAFFGFLSYFLADIILVKQSNPNLIIHGYDIWGNICGENNTPIVNISNSGRNMISKPFLLIESKRSSLNRTCVAKCPNKGYHVTAFYRCMPRDSNVPLLIDAFNITRTFAEEIISDLSICWKELVYLFSISFIFALLLLIFFRFLAGVVIWITLFVISLASISGTLYIWLMWSYYKASLESISIANPERIMKEKAVEQWFVGGLSATIFTIIFLLIVVVMRKRIQLVAKLFKEAGKAISAMPFLLLQPIWTFIILTVISFGFLYGLMYIQSTRIPSVDERSKTIVYYFDPFYKYMKWYHMFAYLWMIHFVISCQHFIIAGAVSCWFFKRCKANLDDTPILKSVNNLIRYHLGSIAFGSLLVAAVKMIRFIFKKLESILNRYHESCDRAIKCCRCCLWCFEKFLIYINKNAFIEIAIYGDSFCVGAQKAFTLLSTNAFRVLAINSVGDFLLLLGKVCVVASTVFIGIELLDEKLPQLNYSWAPIIASALFAYFVSHCFLSVYEMAIDTLFLCFVEDCQRNDGIRRPYYMSSGLMKFVEESQKSFNTIS